MKNPIKTAKYLLFTGITLWIIACGIFAVFPIGVKSWWFILTGAVILLPFMGAGLLYTAQIKHTHRRRCFIIRGVMVFYAVVMGVMTVSRLLA